MDKIFSVKLNKARCAADIGDGSERGEYVPQDYILRRLGRPHRAVSLMYCYYPLDKEFPARISEVPNMRKARFQWDYPYDDYFPYLGGLSGNTDGEPFTSMRDIRRHGQDVILTLTIDPFVSDEHLAAIGDDLRPFGRLFLRINHEATGNWFEFNKRATYQQVADFYCRAIHIIKEHAPNVLTILCIGGVEDLNAEEMVKEKEFAQAVRETDIWSVDKYISLHWGFPFDIAERGGNSHQRTSVKDIFEMIKRSYERFMYLNGGVPKPMLVSELNSDGDVSGAYGQAEDIQRFYDMIEAENADWLSGVTFYQFRDRGRLGLEIQDVNHRDTGVPQPVMDVYRKIIHRPRFMPTMVKGDEVTLPVKLRWGSSEDAEGIAIPLHFDGEPHFCELQFEDDSNLMIEANGQWFYKSPEAKIIDLMPAFFGKKINAPTDMELRIFAPPAGGENDLSLPDGLYNYYCTLEKLPKIRIRTAPTEPRPD
ncbi:hypothetical protein [uncultured Ruminococcus sp.]|uniref:hypothetical protein n=1 Tax=uncultured Ruminococcus sp. TaxID=165186 RepID=UPI0025CE9428|nr:hypothetical protein [uncultured Ruminococcus sp.]